MLLMDELDDVLVTVENLAAESVQRYRVAGILTWSLLHQIEAEVLNAAVRTGEHRSSILNMLCASKVMQYPRDQRAASFEGHGIIPVVFGKIIQAWNHVH